MNCINSTTTSRRTPARNDMQDSLHRKLEELVEHHEDLAHALADPDTIADTDKFQRLAQEYAHLEDLVSDYRQYQGLLTEITDLEDLAGADEGELRDLAAAELETVQARMAELEAALQKHLVPKDPRDNANIYLEIRAGTGGDEAALFAGDLFRMYQQYAEQHRWQVEVLAASEGEHGGYKEIISRLIGKGAYSRLKFESGAHRVQRVPETESQGRVHTSACTVAVMPEAE
ncbi:MAG TPA: PCRF domain-containing protein, partial [Salinisphaeraceae bacterium]|nr:PCRF domain-containing protein [Salinisphaeraceae bacterium]